MGFGASKLLANGDARLWYTHIGGGGVGGGG